MAKPPDNRPKRYVLEAPAGYVLGPDEVDGSNMLLDPDDQVTEEDLNSDTCKMMQGIRRDFARRERSAP
ncbi:hypothetical protein [Methylopila sp. Yamaguchi]|uniref:hypothetical protein n=1 Tax=Methylopila sp. Yamaguchi TaxID=1437817 RepID=UPI0011AEE9CA|nr:hypothetical protein [Methylopila sp. Yamaguchi]